MGNQNKPGDVPAPRKRGMVTIARVGEIRSTPSWQPLGRTHFYTHTHTQTGYSAPTDFRSSDPASTPLRSSDPASTPLPRPAHHMASVPLALQARPSCRQHRVASWRWGKKQSATSDTAERKNAGNPTRGRAAVALPEALESPWLGALSAAAAGAPPRRGGCSGWSAAPLVSSPPACASSGPAAAGAALRGGGRGVGERGSCGATAAGGAGGGGGGGATAGPSHFAISCMPARTNARAWRMSSACTGGL